MEFNRIVKINVLLDGIIRNKLKNTSHKRTTPKVRTGENKKDYCRAEDQLQSLALSFANLLVEGI